MLELLKDGWEPFGVVLNVGYIVFFRRCIGGGPEPPHEHRWHYAGQTLAHGGTGTRGYQRCECGAERLIA